MTSRRTAAARRSAPRRCEDDEQAEATLAGRAAVLCELGRWADAAAAWQEVAQVRSGGSTNNRTASGDSGLKIAGLPPLTVRMRLGAGRTRIRACNGLIVPGGPPCRSGTATRAGRRRRTSGSRSPRRAGSRSRSPADRFMGVCHPPGRMQQPVKHGSPCSASGGGPVSQALACETAGCEPVPGTGLMYPRFAGSRGSRPASGHCRGFSRLRRRDRGRLRLPGAAET